MNWTFTWFDRRRRRQRPLEGGADLIAMHQDSTAAGEAAEAVGAAVVYNGDMSAFAPTPTLRRPLGLGSTTPT